MTEINTGNTIEYYAIRGCADCIDMICVNPTKTLSKKHYKVAYYKKKYRPNRSRDGFYRDMIGVINDKGLYIEVDSNRFI